MNENVLAGGSPPHNEEAETSVLGAILLSPSWLDTVTSEINLTPDDFYRPRHRTIFKAMVEMQNVGESIDSLTVSTALEQWGVLEEVGGRDYVETLVARIPAIANTRSYAQFVKDNSTQRKLLRATQEIQESIATSDAGVDDLVTQAQNRLDAVAGAAINGKGVEAIADYLHDEIHDIEHAAQRETELTGIPTGLHELDHLTAGLQPGTLVIIAGRPSMGKSALATTVGLSALKARVPTVMFSMEMSRKEVTQRMLAQTAMLDFARIRTGDLSETAWPRLHGAAQVLYDQPFLIDDDEDQTTSTIRAKARQISARRVAKGEDPVGLVIVDYLQLLRAEDHRMRHDQAIGKMTKALKIMAREMGIPVILLSQLSRRVEDRKPPKPMLSDLRDSGEIEQDADLVIFIYREEWYDRDSDRAGEADLIIAKHRNGARGELPVGFVGHYPGFCDLQETIQKAKEDAEEKPFVLGRDDPGKDEEIPFDF